MVKISIVTGLLSSLLLTSLVVVTTAPLTASVAEAGFFKKVKKKAKKAAKSVKKSAKKVGKKAGKSAKKLAKKGGSVVVKAASAANKAGIVNIAGPVPLAATLVAGSGTVKKAAKSAKKTAKTLARKSGSVSKPGARSPRPSRVAAANPATHKASKKNCLRKLRSMNRRRTSMRGHYAFTHRQATIWRAQYVKQKARCQKIR